MKKLLSLLPVVMLLLMLSACEKTLIGPEAPNTPEQNFELLWQEYDRLYGNFGVKDVDWHALYQQYRPQVTASTSDEELYAILAQMLDHLNDNHVFLRPLRSTGLPHYNGGILGKLQLEDYDQQVVDQYLLEKKDFGKAISYGHLTPEIGYLHVHHFYNDFSFYPEVMDKVLTELADTRALVLDVRANDGGEDRVAQYLANRFASSTSLSFTSRLRNGPRHTDFAPALKFYTEPAGKFQYTKPVVVLTRRATFSSGDTFVLAMRQNPNVTVVGDTTGGAFSDAVKRELPNGWLYRVSISEVRAADGTSYEGIGIAPDVLVQNRKEELEAGKDMVLEKALEVVR